MATAQPRMGDFVQVVRGLWIAGFRGCPFRWKEKAKRPESETEIRSRLAKAVSVIGAEVSICT